jgi:hypothetical protein
MAPTPTTPPTIAVRVVTTYDDAKPESAFTREVKP